MSFTNTSPKTYPTRGSAPSLGTNPISFFAPAEKGDYFGLDMATTTGQVVETGYFLGKN